MASKFDCFHLYPTTSLAETGNTGLAVTELETGQQPSRQVHGQRLGHVCFGRWMVQIREGFMAELTYGDMVDWYRNVVAAVGCVVLHHGKEYRIDHIEP